MADDGDYKTPQSDQPEGECPEYSSSGVWRMTTGSLNAAVCGAADSDDEDEHRQRDKFRGERSEYYRRSVKDWVDSSRRNPHTKWTNSTRLSLPHTTEADKDRVCGMANGDDELEYSSISSRDSFDEAQYDTPYLSGKEAGSPGHISEAGQTRVPPECGLANGDDQLEYSSISSKESLNDEELSSTHSDKAEGPTTHSPGPTTHSPGPTTTTTNTEATQARDSTVANGDDQLEYSSISSRESLDNDDDQCSDDHHHDPPDTPPPGSPSHTKKEPPQPKECTVGDGDDELEYSSISSKDSLDDAQSNISDDELMASPLDHTTHPGRQDRDSTSMSPSFPHPEPHQDSRSSEAQDTAKECTMTDTDEKKVISSFRECIDDIQSSSGDDWPDQLSASPGHISSPDQDTECIADDSDDDFDEHLQHDQFDGDDQEESNSPPPPTLALSKNVEMYPKANNISKAWLVVNGQTSPIILPAKSKPVILSSIKSRCHVLLQVQLTTNNYPKFIIGAFIHQMARDATWVYNRLLDRWETIICHGRERTSEGTPRDYQWEEPQYRSREDWLDRLSHSSGHSTKTDHDRDYDMVDSDDAYECRQRVGVQRPRLAPSPTLSSSHRAKGYHPEANNISRAWVIINGRTSTISAINKTKAIITAALKYRRHVLIQVRLSVSSPSLSLGAFIVSIAGKARWSYNSLSQRWEATIGQGGVQRQLEEGDMRDEFSEDHCSSQDSRLFDPGPTLPPMLNFKAFMEQCEDSITEVEALRKYSNYKRRFKSQELCDFSTHEEEEWMVLEEWRDDRRDADEGSGGGDWGGYVPSPEDTRDSDHPSVPSTESDREDQRDLDEDSGSRGLGDHVPSPDHHTQDSNHSQGQSSGANRDQDTLVASSPLPAEPLLQAHHHLQATPPRLDTNNDTHQQPDFEDISPASPAHSSAQQPQRDVTTTPPSRPDRGVRPQRTRKPPERYS